MHQLLTRSYICVHPVESCNLQDEDALPKQLHQSSKPLLLIMTCR